jgi:hypothetical protein
MRRLPEQILRDEVEMRAFYESIGISQSTIDAAILVRWKGADGSRLVPTVHGSQ